MTLRIEQDGRLCRIALAAPEKRNVLDAAACRELLHEVKGAAVDPATGAILLEADGPVFCAGAECEDPELFDIGRVIGKPIVAAVQGVAVSGGLALVANAHIVVAAQGTSFGLTEIREGQWRDPVFCAVAAAVGPRRALELSLTGRVFSAADALAWGLVHYIAAGHELDDRTTEIAVAVANSSAEAVRKALKRGAGGA